jgi:hypothetical protein
VSQYLNVPINPDEPSNEEKYPKATVRKYKAGKDGKQHSNVPLMKDPSDNSYLVSHMPSQSMNKNSSENFNKNNHLNN